MPTRTLLLAILLFSLAALLTVYYSGISLQVEVQSSASSAAGSAATGSSIADLKRISNLNLTDRTVRAQALAEFQKDLAAFRKTNAALEAIVKKRPPIVSKEGEDVIDIDALNRGLPADLRKKQEDSVSRMLAFLRRMAELSNAPLVLAALQEIYNQNPDLRPYILSAVFVPRDDYRRDSYEGFRRWLKGLIASSAEPNIQDAATLAFLDGLTPMKPADFDFVQQSIFPKISRSRQAEIISGGVSLVHDYALDANALNFLKKIVLENPDLKESLKWFLSAKYPAEYYPDVSQALSGVGLYRSPVRYPAAITPPGSSLRPSYGQYLAQLPGSDRLNVTVSDVECELEPTMAHDEKIDIGYLTIKYGTKDKPGNRWLPYGSDSEDKPGDEPLQGEFTLYNQLNVGPPLLSGHLALRDVSDYLGTSGNTPNPVPPETIGYEDACFNIDLPNNPPECQWRVVESAPKRPGCAAEIDLPDPVEDGKTITCPYEVYTYDNAAYFTVEGTAWYNNYKKLSALVKAPTDSDVEGPDRLPDYWEVNNYIRFGPGPNDLARFNPCTNRTLLGNNIPTDPLVDFDRKSGSNPYEQEANGENLPTWQEYRGFSYLGSRPHRGDLAYEIPTRMGDPDYPMITEDYAVVDSSAKQLFINDDVRGVADFDLMRYDGPQKIRYEAGVDPIYINKSQYDAWARDRVITMDGRPIGNLSGGINFNNHEDPYAFRLDYPQAAVKFRLDKDNMGGPLGGANVGAGMSTLCRRDRDTDRTFCVVNDVVLGGIKVLGMPIVVYDESIKMMVDALTHFYPPMPIKEILQGAALHELSGHKLSNGEHPLTTIFNVETVTWGDPDDPDQWKRDAAEWVNDEWEGSGRAGPSLDQFYIIELPNGRNEKNEVLYDYFGGRWEIADIYDPVPEIIDASNSSKYLYNHYYTPFILFNSSEDSRDVRKLARIIPRIFTNHEDGIRGYIFKVFLYFEDQYRGVTQQYFPPGSQKLETFTASAGRTLTKEGDGGRYHEVRHSILAPPTTSQAQSIFRLIDPKRKGLDLP